MSTAITDAPTKNRKLTEWVSQVAELTEPDSVHWCDGSAEEYDQLCVELVENGTFEKLSEAKRPNSYLAPLGPGRRRASGGQDLHLLAHRGRGGPDEQLGRSG